MTDESKPTIYGSPNVMLAMGGILLACVLAWQAPEIIKAIWPVVPVPVNPDITPQPVSSFVARVKQAYDGDESDTTEIVDNYTARRAILGSDVAIADTKQLSDIWLRASQLAYGETRYKGARFAKLWRVIYDEAVERGLLAKDADNDGRPDEPLPVDRKGWSQLYGEIVEALQ